MGGQRRGRRPVVERYGFETAADMARALPQLFRPISDSPTLIDEERESLAQCEAAVETLKVAFWAAGKALQIIRDSRLYRATHDSFDAYCLDRWDMTKSYATRLIRTWRIAEALFELESNGTVPIGTMRKVAQTQMWELVPVADTWDVSAAAFVYRTVLEVDGVEVTAAVLGGTVKALPAGSFDQRAAAEAIHAHLAAQADDQDDETDYEARAKRAVPYGWLKRIAQKDRATAAAYLDHVQAQVDRARAELLADDLPAVSGRT
jgi:hypothetical protein